MRSDLVTIEPEVIQLGRDSSQTLKVINNTNTPLPNLFFCLYNTEKISFTPDSFSLAPHEHKLITVTLRLKAVRSNAQEYAYLRSSEFNRKIIIIVNSFVSPDPKLRSEEGLQDAHTLSSRQYNEMQQEAIQRMIREKDSYIEMLERENQVNRQINFRTEESGAKDGLRRELEQMDVRLIMAENQKQSILQESLAIQDQFELYRKTCETDLKNYQKVSQLVQQQKDQIEKLMEDIQFFQQQGKQYNKKLEEKESRIRELEIQYRKGTQEYKREMDKRSALESRLEQQKRSYNETSRQSEERIKELQWRLEGNEKLKQKSNELERELRRREEQVRQLTSVIESQRNTLRELEGEKKTLEGDRRQLEGERKKVMRLEALNESMVEKNAEITSRVRELEKVNHNLREEVLVYRSKMAEQDLSSDKMAQYFDTAMHSLKTENQSLKRAKIQLEKEISDCMLANRQAQDQVKALTDKLGKHQEEGSLLEDIRNNLQRKCEDLKQEHHLVLMKLKTENVELLEKLSAGEATRRQERIQHLEDALRRTEDELVFKAREIQKYRVDLDQQTIKAEALMEENAKLSERVKRYKKEAKKELRSINDSAISQLNKTNEENKQMSAQIAQLQAVIAHYDCERLRQEREREEGRTKSQGGKSHGRSGQKRGTEESHHLRKERTSSRAIGIKDQRKEIQQSSKSYSQTSHQEAYSELGELRQLNNYIRNEEQRLNRVLELEGEEEENYKDERPVFRAIRFFKRVEGKMRELRGQSQLSSVKEVQFLKGRIRQLQSLKDENANLSNTNLSKTRQQLGQLLQYVRQEMRSQYKKLNDHIKLGEQKHELLKRKIYEQYRAKLLEALSKKEKSGIQQLELTLQRFIDSMSNLSHKEAVLHKEVKLKQHARKQNIQLREKVTSLNHLLQTKKGCCTRDPLKLLYSEAEQEWQDSLKREAELLTLSAEYQRLKEEFQLQGDELTQAKQSQTRLEKELDQRAAEVLRLKRYQIELQTNYQNQLQKQHEIIEQNKKKIIQFTRTGKDPKPKDKEREREYQNMKENLQKQKDVIRVLREKEKMLQEVLEEQHKAQEKERRKVNEESRVVESMRDLRDNNRELRTENAKLKEKNAKLEQDLQKKNVYLKNMKGDMEENRIRVQRKQEGQAERLREEAKRLNDELKRARDDLDKAKKKRDKEAAEHKNEVDRLTNENLINVKSLESVIRALMDNLRDIYSRLRYYAKKRKGQELEDKHDLFDTSRTVNIDGLKISEAFERALAAVQASD